MITQEARVTMALTRTSQFVARQNVIIPTWGTANDPLADPQDRTVLSPERRRMSMVMERDRVALRRSPLRDHCPHVPQKLVRLERFEKHRQTPTVGF